MEKDFLPEPVIDGITGNGFKVKKGKFRLEVRKKIFTVNVEALAWVVRRSCGCSTLGSLHIQFGRNFE